MAATAELTQRVDTLRRAVADHKKAIKHHKTRLHVVAAELAELEAHCHRLKLGLYVQHGVGGIHGRSDTNSESHNP